MRTARWITHPDWVEPTEETTAPPVLQRAFTAPIGAVNARVEVMAVGVWVMHLNGHRIDDAELRPGMSEFQRRIETVTVDVTRLMRPGRNVITVELGEGAAHVRRVRGRYTKFVRRRWAPMAKISLEFDAHEGNQNTIDSDDQWRCWLGPTRLGHWYGGEEYDARLEPDDWPTAIPGDAGPVAVLDIAEEPIGWQRSAPPVRVLETRGDLELTPTADGVWLVDAGRNLAGREVLRLADDAPAGVRLEIWPSEYLDDRSRVDQRSTGAPIFDAYVTAGGPARWWPKFCYHGFRYLELRATEVARGAVVPDADRWLSVDVERLMTDNRPVGRFHCDDPLLNDLHRLIEHAIESNLFSVPTDCPHREKLGWLEQTHLMFRPIARSFQIEQHWAELITHMIDAQTASGLIPDIAPELVVFDFDPAEHDWPFNPEGFRDDVNWGSAILQVPLQLYRTYGALDPLRTAWPAGRRYLEYLRRRSAGGLLATGLGDWITEDSSTPASLVAGRGHLRLLRSATEAARLLGLPEAENDYSRQAARVAALLRSEHVRPGNAGGRPRFGSGSQASLALLIDSGVLTDDEHRTAGRELRRVLSEGDDAITVGEIGLPALVDVLSGLDDELLYRVALNPRHPSYRTMIDTGFTALAESWRGADTTMSANHLMLGYIDSWLLERVAGLRQAPDDVGWREVVVAPRPVADVTAAETEFDSPQGRYRVRWQLDGDRGAIELALPDGAAARIEAPPGWVIDPRSATISTPGEHTIGCRRHQDHQDMAREEAPSGMPSLHPDIG